MTASDPNRSGPDPGGELTGTLPNSSDRILEAYMLHLEQGGSDTPGEFLAGSVDDGLANGIDRQELEKNLASIRLVHDAGQKIQSQMSAFSDFPKAGTRLGDFQILRPLGRGGMGVVYLATQVSLNRLVALKILTSAGLLDGSARSRFQLEARAAAALQHPNIVPVHAVGSESGTEFYAMQFIAGKTLQQSMLTSPGVEATTRNTAGKNSTAPTAAAETIADSPAPAGTFPKQVALGQKRSLEITWQIADALDHAHRAGIVHRDVKPSNILIDETGKPWLADFGLAHVEQEATLTAPGAILGSLRYMSPEQLDPASGVVDHRTDVYGLGAVLYEMLTGHPAVRGRDRKEILRQLLNGQITPPRRIESSISRDMETVVIKSLHADPGHRYETMGGFAKDLKALLDGKPVSAKRNSVLARSIAWTRRNPVVAALSACVGLLLAAGLVYASVTAVRLGRLAEDRQLALNQATLANQAAQVALEKSQMLAESNRVARDSATMQLIKAKRISDFLLAIFRSPNPNRDGKSITVLELLVRANETINRDNSISPELRADLLGVLYDSMHELGLHRERLSVARQVIGLFQDQLGPSDPRLISWRLAEAGTLNDLGEYEQARQVLVPTLVLASEQLGDNDIITVRVMNCLVRTLHNLEEYDQAWKLLDEAVERSQGISGETGNEMRIAMANLAHRFRIEGRLDKSVEILEKIQAISESQSGDEPRRIYDMINLGGALRDAGRTDQAEEMLTKAHAAAESLHGPDHPDTVTAGNNLAQVYFDKQNYERAIELGYRVLESRRRTLGESHPSTVTSMINLAWALRKTERFEQSMELANQAELATLGPDGKSSRMTLAARSLQASLYGDRGDYARSASVFSGILEAKRAVLGPENPDTLVSLNNYAAELYRAENMVEAERCFLELVERGKSQENPDWNGVRNSLRWLHLVQLRLNRFEEAEETIDQWIELTRTGTLDVKSEIEWAKVSRLEALLGQGRIDEVIPKGQLMLDNEADQRGTVAWYRLQGIVGSARAQNGEVEMGVEMMTQAVAGIRGRLRESLDHLRWYGVRAAERLVDFHAGAGDEFNREKWQGEVEQIEAEIARIRDETVAWKHEK